MIVKINGSQTLSCSSVNVTISNASSNISLSVLKPEQDKNYYQELIKNVSSITLTPFGKEEIVFNTEDGSGICQIQYDDSNTSVILTFSLSAKE